MYEDVHSVSTNGGNLRLSSVDGVIVALNVDTVVCFFLNDSTMCTIMDLCQSQDYVYIL